MKSGESPTLQMTGGSLYQTKLCFPGLSLQVSKRPQSQGPQSQPPAAGTAGLYPPVTPDVSLAQAVLSFLPSLFLFPVFLIFPFSLCSAGVLVTYAEVLALSCLTSHSIHRVRSISSHFPQHPQGCFHFLLLFPNSSCLHLHVLGHPQIYYPLCHQAAPILSLES